MDRRRFLGFGSSLLSGVVLEKPVDWVSSGHRSTDLVITVIAPPVTFAAAREGVHRAFSSGLMFENVTVRLRSWWPANADPELPELIRFGENVADFNAAATGPVVTVESAADPSVESLLAALPPLSRRLTRVISSPREGEEWPAETLISPVRHEGADVVHVPAYWDQQFWWQVAHAPAGHDGNRSLADVEAVRFQIGVLFRREERNISQVLAVALVSASSSVKNAIGGIRMPPIVLRCVRDELGLRSTRLEVL